MAQIGIRCPVYGPVLHEDCKTCSLNSDTYRCMIPLPILELMRKDETEERKHFYSASQLTGCRRKEVLIENAGDYYIQPENEWPKVHGTLVHSAMAELEYPGALDFFKEQRLFTKFQVQGREVTFSGRIDLIVVNKIDKYGTIHISIFDWKTTKTNKHESDLGDDYTLQIGLYKWLCERDPEDEYGKKFFAGKVIVDELQVCILGPKLKRFSSLYSFKTEGKQLKDHSGYEELILNPIPTLTDEQIEEFLTREMGFRFHDSMEHLPDVLGVKDNWKCASCPVQRKCKELAKYEKGKN